MEDYATLRQKRAIAKLCGALRIKAPLEDNPLTVAMAGRLIRNLSDQLKLERRVQGRKS